jgi:hypothetical protein
VPDERVARMRARIAGGIASALLSGLLVLPLAAALVA